LLEELQKANARLERQEHHMHLLLKRLYFYSIILILELLGL